MTSRKIWVEKGIYDNRESQRREKYDHLGNVIESSGIGYIQKRGHKKFGSYPDIPKKS